MSPFEISLPATSANLGPGFDAMALALELYLRVRAEESTTYIIDARGRDAEVCSRLQRNLMLAVYQETLRAADKPVIPLAIRIENSIPIGMGCGSSAAARLAGLSLANHFGGLDWDGDHLLQQACSLEGHPDNAAACWLGGLTVAAGSGEAMRATSIDPPKDWAALLVLPDHPLATVAARAVLPTTYSRQDAVSNIQNAALLTAAFHSARPDLLRFAMMDHLHQSYRSEVCPLLPVLLPLAGEAGILGVALSGAGPAVIAMVEKKNLADARDLIQKSLSNLHEAEILEVALSPSFSPARRS